MILSLVKGAFPLSIRIPIGTKAAVHRTLQALHSHNCHARLAHISFASSPLSTMTPPLPPRRFAPLRHGASSTDRPLQGIVFDVDGTLCEPQNYMFAEMRSVLGIPKTIDILDHIYSLPTPAAQEAAMEAIRAIERTAMASQVAQPGLAALMAYLDARGVRKAICTRNFELPVAHLLAKFLADTVAFAPIVTRDFRPPKPHPAGIWHIARSWGLTRPGGGGTAEGEVERRQGAEKEAEADATGLIMVGDSIDDMTAGRRAGAATVLLVNEANAHLAEHDNTDLVIRTLDELIGILEDGFTSRDI